MGAGYSSVLNGGRDGSLSRVVPHRGSEPNEEEHLLFRQI